ncbi:hypothetical protein ABZ615_07350 [Streptomyces sp. NPDC007325]|uniref:hypothetical protein n=1 Tax=Streptomyces sp. NPDC007325 TaxID=3154588 RepID=UPI003401AB6C
MRSARILFATAATAATLALTTPGAYALAAGERDKDDSAHSQKRDHGKPHGGMHTGSGALSLNAGDDWSKDTKDTKDTKDKEKGKDHGKPYGGMHTGSGALSAVNADDWGKPEQQKPEGYKHDKPKGGMHTGGGGLAGNSVSLTGALVLAGGAAAVVLHRRKTTAGASA